MYVQAKEQTGGWAEFKPFRVVRKVQESDVITSFYLTPQDGRAVAAFEPGQYVSVNVNIPGEPNTHIRQYSLSDAPGKPYYRISVKREDALEARPAGKVSYICTIMSKKARNSCFPHRRVHSPWISGINARLF